MFLFLVSAALSTNPAQITSISVSDMYKKMYNASGLTTPMTAASYSSAGSNTYFIIRQAGDLEKGANTTYDFYEVVGTPAEMAQFKASCYLMPSLNKTIENLGSGNIVFIQFKNSASYYQQAVFWVCIVAFIIFIGGVASGLLLWHYDRYDLDPANSLLFVTEGNLIVSGANDPK